MKVFSRIVFTVFLTILVACADGARPTEEAVSATKETQPRVETLERRLLIDGNDFLIRGVGYSPSPIGVDPEVTAPYGDYYTTDYSAIYTRDLPLIRKMGANTIRLWGWNNAADHTAFLDAAYNQGVKPIYVIVSFWIGGGQNLTDPATRERLVNDFQQMVARHKNHPAVLMWMVGNELNAPWMYGNTDALFTLVNEMAKAAHAEEGAAYHPVTTPLADVNLITTIQLRDEIVPDLDAWSVQMYRGKSFGSFFQEYQASSDKPLLVSEYGIDAYDDTRADEYENFGEAHQAVYAAALWKEIEACTVCVGGSIMAYSDEWWKGKHGQTGSGHTDCPENNPAAHSACGYANASHPDGYANEEWWGMMRAVKNGSQPDRMQPREVYSTLQSLWVKETYLPVVKR